MLKKILITVFCTIFLSACSNKSSVEEITFSSWGSITEVSVLQDLIKDFEAKNPKIKVNFIHVPQNYFQKIHLLFASNTAPDVIFINNLYLPLYENQLKDLSGYINKQNFYEQSIEALSYENKLLAIPRDISNLVLYVNTDIIDLPDKHWTLENLLEKALLAKEKGYYGISFEEDIYWLSPYLSYFGENFDNKYHPKASSAYNFYINLRNKYRVAPTKSEIGSSTLAQMFLDKKIAMYLSGRWMYPKISETASFNWSVINFPYGKTPLPCDASGWAISKNTKNFDSALKFVKFLSDEESAKYFAKTNLIVPANKKASCLLNKSEHNEKVFLEIIEKSSKTNITKDYKKSVDNFNSKFF